MLLTYLATECELRDSHMPLFLAGAPPKNPWEPSSTHQESKVTTAIRHKYDHIFEGDRAIFGCWGSAQSAAYRSGPVA